MQNYKGVCAGDKVGGKKIEKTLRKRRRLISVKFLGRKSGKLRKNDSIERKKSTEKLH